MGDTFQVAHKNLEVKSDMAEEYGYTDNVTDGISALDALVAAHIDKYGADKATINSKLTMAGGNPTLMMGEAAASGFSGFSVNEGYVKDANGWGAVVDSAEVKSGDRVDFSGMKIQTGVII